MDRTYLIIVNEWIVTKRKKLVPTFLHHIKDHSFQFSKKKNGW